MADEFPDDGIVGNGLIVNGFYDLEHIQKVPGNRIFRCLSGGSVPAEDRHIS